MAGRTGGGGTVSRHFWTKSCFFLQTRYARQQMIRHDEYLPIAQMPNAYAKNAYGRGVKFFKMRSTF